MILLAVGTAGSTLAGALWLARLVVGTPPLIVASAVLPAIGYAAVLVWLSGPARPPARVVALALGWGALIASAGAAAVNDLGLVTPVVSGPLVEEVAKASGLLGLRLLVPLALRGVRDGITCGALIGIGFTLAENLGYLTLAAVQGGPAGLARGVYLRGLLGGANHAVFAAATGAGLGWAWQHGGRRIVPVLAGLGAALLQHGLWNALASGAITDVLCNPAVAGGACRAEPSRVGLFLVAPLVELAAVGPGLVALVILGLRGADRRAQA
jgi:RsiW-degrading membrane proteinase PrsW (M82 family)